MDTTTLVFTPQLQAAIEKAEKADINPSLPDGVTLEQHLRNPDHGLIAKAIERYKTEGYTEKAAIATALTDVHAMLEDYMTNIAPKGQQSLTGFGAVLNQKKEEQQRRIDFLIEQNTINIFNTHSDATGKPSATFENLVKEAEAAAILPKNLLGEDDDFREEYVEPLTRANLALGYDQLHAEKLALHRVGIKLQAWKNAIARNESYDLDGGLLKEIQDHQKAAEANDKRLEAAGYDPESFEVAQPKLTAKSTPATTTSENKGLKSPAFWGQIAIALGAIGIGLFAGDSKKPENTEQGQQTEKQEPGWFRRNAKWFMGIVAAALTLDAGYSLVDKNHRPILGKFTDMVSNKFGSQTRTT